MLIQKRCVRMLTASALMFFLGMPLAHSKMAVVVTTDKIENLLFYPKHRVAATTLSLNQTQVKNETPGRIVSLPPLVGDVVQKGAVLATLDCRDQTYQKQQSQAALEGTQARLDLLTWQLKQSKQLAENKNASLEKIKTLESELKLMQAQLQTHVSQLDYAALQVDRCQIHAPFDGVVTQRFSHLGEYIGSGTPLVELVSHEELEAQAFFHPEEVLRLQNVQRLQFQVQDKVYPIKIRKQVQNLDQRTHTQEIRFVFTGPRPLPGTLGKVVWQDTHAHLPSELLLQRGQQFGVFIKNKDKAKFVAIQGAREGQPIPMPNPLRDDLIIQGRQQLEDGFELVMKQEVA